MTWQAHGVDDGGVYGLGAIRRGESIGPWLRIRLTNAALVGIVYA